MESKEVVARVRGAYECPGCFWQMEYVPNDYCRLTPTTIRCGNEDCSLHSRTFEMPTVTLKEVDGV